jgi:hypothetical protein
MMARAHSPFGETHKLSGGTYIRVPREATWHASAAAINAAQLQRRSHLVDLSKAASVGPGDLIWESDSKCCVDFIMGATLVGPESSRGLVLKGSALGHHQCIACSHVHSHCTWSAGPKRKSQAMKKVAACLARLLQIWKSRHPQFEGVLVECSHLSCTTYAMHAIQGEFRFNQVW